MMCNTFLLSYKLTPSGETPELYRSIDLPLIIMVNHGKNGVIAYYVEKAPYPTGPQVMFYSKKMDSRLF